MRKNLNREQLTDVVSAGVGLSPTIEQAISSIDTDVSEEFFHMCIEYKREDINERLIEVVTPVTATSLTIKCPYYLGNYKEKEKFVNTFGSKEREVLLKILKRNSTRGVSEDDISKTVAGEDLRITPETVRNVLTFFEEEVRRESDKSRPAMLFTETFYEMLCADKSVLISSSNNATIVGKDNYRIYTIKVSDDDEFSESYFNRFRDIMFINAVAALGRVDSKNIIVSTLVVKSNGILPILMWKVPKNILSVIGETPESLLKKYISKNMYYLVDGNYFNFPEYKNTNFCPYCGYNQTPRCKSKKQ